MQLENVIISDEKKFARLKQNIVNAGVSSLQVVSDFDKTLTSCFVEGKKITSLISILRDEHYLTPDYSAKAQALYDHYHPIEVDSNITLEAKKTQMHEWWRTHYELLIASKLSKGDLNNVVQSQKIQLRPGADAFFGSLKSAGVPLTILSAAGVGADAIAMYLERFNLLSSNVNIASNNFIWDEFGQAIAIADPIVHTLNKDFNIVKQFSFFSELKNRRNVILLGDALTDANMLNGFEVENVIKIGFLNEDSQGKLLEYQRNFDVIILNDTSMNPVLTLFKQAFDTVILGDGPLTFINILLSEIVLENQK
ncbi:MAG: hypothetical protein WCK11_00105 [Candidatus Falkowbacteria bacterium]